MFVVWNGIEPGIYSTWSECLNQFEGIKNPLFKKFDLIDEAKKAIRQPASRFFDIEEVNQETDYISVISNGVKQDDCSKFWAFDNYNIQLFFKSSSYRNVNVDQSAFLGIVQTLEYLRLKEDIRPIHCSSQKAVHWLNSGIVPKELFDNTNVNFIKKIKKAEELLTIHDYFNDVLVEQ